MRLVTFITEGGAPKAGLVVGNQIADLAGLGFGDVLSFLEAGESGIAAASDLAVSPGEIFDRTEVTLLAPIPRPSKFICIGLNYRDHAIEAGMEIPTTPTVFTKYNNAVIGPEQAIELPSVSNQVDYEAEFALLIGEKISYGDEDVLTKIAGIGLALDLTLRDVQSELKSKGHPWERAKAYDGSCPVTPFYQLESATELASAEYNYWQNSELKQHGKTQLMLFSIERLLKEITEHFTLCPGDLVLTGTPEGVGVLHHGDELQLQYQAYFPINAFVTID